MLQRVCVCVSPLILVCAMVLVMVMTGSYYMHATSWVSNEITALIVEHMAGGDHMHLG